MNRLASPYGLSAAWFALVLAGAWPRRPRPTRLDHLVPSRPPVGSGRRSAVERLGGGLRRAAHRRALSSSSAGVGSSFGHDGSAHPAADRRADRRVGLTVIVAGVAAVISVWLTLLIVVGAWAAASARRRSGARRRAGRVADDLPDVVDLFALAAGSGLTVTLSVEAVARHAAGPIGHALAAAVRRQQLGERSADALARLPEEAGEAVRPLTNALVASERYGTALVPALEALAEEVGRQRRRRAEERARRAPVKLIFPLVLCSLPAFALLTVVPLLLSTLGSLHF